MDSQNFCADSKGQATGVSLCWSASLPVRKFAWLLSQRRSWCCGGHDKPTSKERTKSEDWAGFTLFRDGEKTFKLDTLIDPRQSFAVGQAFATERKAKASRVLDTETWKAPCTARYCFQSKQSKLGWSVMRSTSRKLCGLGSVFSTVIHEHPWAPFLTVQHRSIGLRN